MDSCSLGFEIGVQGIEMEPGLFVEIYYKPGLLTWGKNSEWVTIYSRGPGQWGQGKTKDHEAWLAGLVLHYLQDSFDFHTTIGFHMTDGKHVPVEGTAAEQSWKGQRELWGA